MFSSLFVSFSEFTAPLSHQWLEKSVQITSSSAVALWNRKINTKGWLNVHFLPNCFFFFFSSLLMKWLVAKQKSIVSTPLLEGPPLSSAPGGRRAQPCAHPRPSQGSYPADFPASLLLWGMPVNLHLFSHFQWSLSAGLVGNRKGIVGLNDGRATSSEMSFPLYPRHVHLHIFTLLQNTRQKSNSCQFHLNLWTKCH